MSLKGKHILLGITGSIAAYKAAMLVRALVKEGAEVRVVMTEMAKQFITPLTMATLSKNPILVEFFDPENGQWNSHVSLGIWADLYLIAPASANTISKMATGIADNLLLTTYLSSRCPVAVAPAMDLDMFMHPTVTSSLLTLKDRGAYIIEPAAGELASGLDGKGRMEEPEIIVAEVKSILSKEGPFRGRKVLITAGATVEEIDPVRYISNYSTGKMAYALAESFASKGAEVELVSGPTNINLYSPDVNITKVKSAAEMADTTLKKFKEGVDIAVLCAAVADYRPKSRSDIKIKREAGDMTLELEPNVDIAASIGAIKKDEFVVGFALETNNAEDNACGKMKKKNLDMIVLNSLADSGAGFATDTNKITIFHKDGDKFEFPLKSKKEVAEDIVDNVQSKCLCLND